LLHCKLRKFVNILTLKFNPAPYAQFRPLLYQNAFGGRVLPEPDGGAYGTLPEPLAGFGGGDGGKERIVRGRDRGKGKGG